MMKVVSTLQNKPRTYRTKVAFSAAVAMTSFIFLVWVSTLPGRIAERTADLSATNVNVSAVPFAVDQFSEQFDQIQGTIELLRSNDTYAPKAEQTPLTEPELTY